MNSSLLLDALHCRNLQRPPVWLMRQAGRYMTSYRALRSRYSFLEMIHQPELVADVTLLPIDAFGVDAAILFSDILTVIEALGCGLEFKEKKGPVIERPVRTVTDINNLPKTSLREELSYVAEGIKATKTRLSVPLIGFCGGIFTVASYLIEGGSSKNFSQIKGWMYREPQAVHLLFDLLTTHTEDYLRMQVEAGVDTVQIFDTWAGSLACAEFEEFILPYQKRLVQCVTELGKPVILFCRGTSTYYPQLASLKPNAIALDWQCKVKQVREVLGESICLQGNLDPTVLYGSPAALQKSVNSLLDDMDGDKGFIVNLGHGIFPDIAEDQVRRLVDCVKSREMSNVL